jgi:hypothetical protein
VSLQFIRDASPPVIPRNLEFSLPRWGPEICANLISIFEWGGGGGVSSKACIAHHTAVVLQERIMWNIVAEWLGCRTQPEGRGFESRRRHDVVSVSRVPLDSQLGVAIISRILNLSTAQIRPKDHTPQKWSCYSTTCYRCYRQGFCERYLGYETVTLKKGEGTCPYPNFTRSLIVVSLMYPAMCANFGI